MGRPTYPSEAYPAPGNLYISVAKPTFRDTSSRVWPGLLARFSAMMCRYNDPRKSDSVRTKRKTFHPTMVIVHALAMLTTKIVVKILTSRPVIPAL